ncbi:sigma 54-interacting transcriptional regulator [Maridesulfovibrio sp.]|uniref:sigma-54-dependent Fis family transcriptional regulator n=1 Tax=Maridesulfovibrio sp. TaxID=2795000 RepID=UPI002A18D97B|nr:sigma 54-interacting transcriptional regulator [Maridesulfovibrio sp.]
MRQTLPKNEHGDRYSCNTLLTSAPEHGLREGAGTSCTQKVSGENGDCGIGTCRGRIVPLLRQMSEMLSDSSDFSGALDRLLAYMRKEMGIKRGMVSLYDRESGRIFVHRSIGLTPAEEDRGVYFMGEGITGRVVETARPIVVSRIGDEPSYLNRTKSISGGLDLDYSFMCVPIVRGSKVLGTISAERRYDDKWFLEKHLDVLVVASYILAHALELYLIENVDKVQWENRTRQLINRLKEQFKPPNIIGTSAPMREVYGLIRKVAPAWTTVLLLGESGVGKEMIADAIHYSGPVPEGPLVKFNCAALPENLVESELFGHEKGAFTGAIQSRKGKFEEADGGTLFLDEIGELSLGVQAKLLRVLQDRQFERLGGNRSITVSIRIVAATNRNLADMVEEGTFRQDLYYRLNVFPIMIPPLRERGNDIVTLAEHFVARYAKETEKRVTFFSTSALNMLTRHNWPGNVRELENVVQRAVILADDETIHSHDLPLTLKSPLVLENSAPNGLEVRLANIEYEMVVEALRQHRGNVTEAANALGLTRRTMGLRMKRFNLNYKSFRQAASREGLSKTARKG